MADETTYESEMNQPAHRPGMESVVNRGPAVKMQSRNAPEPIMQSRDKNGNETQAERPTVAPGRIDPFSIKDDPAPKRTPAPANSAPAGTDQQTNQGISGIGGRTRESQVMNATDKAVTG